MHPCPKCGSTFLTLTERVLRERKVVLSPNHDTTSSWDIDTRAPYANTDVSVVCVHCDTCTHRFTFDLACYRWARGTQREENPYDHAFSLSGCREDCQACAWDNDPDRGV